MTTYSKASATSHNVQTTYRTRKKLNQVIDTERKRKKGEREGEQKRNRDRERERIGEVQPK